MAAGVIEAPRRWTANAVRQRDASAPETLAQRLGRGDVDAVGQAYDELHAKVRAFARRLVGDDDVAEDLVQEVFVTLPRAMRSFRGDSALDTFVISIAVNHARHHVRAAVRRRQAAERFGREPQRETRSPETEAANRQLARRLCRALDELPLEQRIAFVLCEVEERTAVEAAVLLGAPEATVRTRHARARQRLRQILGEGERP